MSTTKDPASEWTQEIIIVNSFVIHCCRNSWTSKGWWLDVWVKTIKNIHKKMEDSSKILPLTTKMYQVLFDRNQLKWELVCIAMAIVSLLQSKYDRFKQITHLQYFFNTQTSVNAQWTKRKHRQRSNMEPCARYLQVPVLHSSGKMKHWFYLCPAVPGGHFWPASRESSASPTPQRGWWACSWGLLCTVCHRWPCQRAPGCWAYPSLFLWTTSTRHEETLFTEHLKLSGDVVVAKEPARTNLLLGFASRLVDWVLVLLGLPSVLLLVLLGRLKEHIR